MVAFDASIALPLWFPGVPCSVTKAKERIDYLVSDLGKRHEKILIPTPALSELLINAGAAGAEFVNKLNKSSRFELWPFDQIAAIEVALSLNRAKKLGSKRGKHGKDVPWAKVKFDHQIVAICKCRKAQVLYSDDPGLRTFAEHCGLRVVGLAELPLPVETPTLFDDLPTESEGKLEEKPNSPVPVVS